MEEAAAFAEIGKTLMGVLGKIKASWDGAAAGMNKAVETLPQAIDAVAAPAKATMAVFVEIGSSLGSAIRGTFGALTDGVSQIAGAVAPFVQALNPSVLLQFQQAFRGLQATIGVALQPVMEVLTQVSRQVAGVLLPVMQQLAPILRTVATAFGEILVGWLRAFASAAEALMPALEFLAGVFRSLAEALKVYYTVVQASIQTIAGMFGKGDLKDALKSFQDILRQVVKGLVEVIAFIARSFGQTAFLNNLIKDFQALTRPQPAGQAPAPQAAGITGAESIMKEMQVAAFTALGPSTDQTRSDNDYLKDIAKAIQEIKNGKTFEQLIKEKLDQLPEDIKKKAMEFYQWLRGQTRQTLEQLPREVTAFTASTAAAGIQPTLGAAFGGIASLFGR